LSNTDQKECLESEFTEYQLMCVNCGDVGKQTKPIINMPCPCCDSINTEIRLPRDTSNKQSILVCENCKGVWEFP